MKNIIYEPHFQLSYCWRASVLFSLALAKRWLAQMAGPRTLPVHSPGLLEKEQRQKKET